jgi:putative ABC transport system ATP-binding protein
MTDHKSVAPAYELRGVSKTYSLGGGQVHAVRDVNLTIEAGETVAVAGPSGSGKTTLLQLLGALDRPSMGEIIFEGRDIARSGDGALGRLRLGTFGFIFQQFNLIPTLTAAQNVEIALAPSGGTAGKRRAAVIRLLASVGLAPRADHVPSKLSGGEQQRVAIARALANEPHVLLADEPTGNLDTRTSIEVMGIFQRLNIERGITVLLITHEMDIAEYGTRLVRFRDGRIQVDQKITNRRDAVKELAALPPPEEEPPDVPSDEKTAEHFGGVV